MTVTIYKYCLVFKEIQSFPHVLAFLYHDIIASMA
jgi:hypothetical protein